MYFLASCFLFVTVVYSSAALDIVGSCESSYCPSGQRCVLNRVQCVTTPCDPIKTCIDGTNPDKPGECPAPKPGQVGICVVQCFGDDSCPGSQKCCGSCPKACTEPVNLPEKPGRCPPRLLGFFGGWCSRIISQCTCDSDCGGQYKCCNTGCGHRCTRPFLDMPIDQPY